MPLLAYCSFTFHDVSIKSVFLSLSASLPFFFTFHDVSIKSRKEVGKQIPTGTLHSTMSLLNPDTIPPHRATRCNFTFHNVSIKSTDTIKQQGGALYFTFHNVSIKSRLQNYCKVPVNHLYIPQCLY